MTGLRTVAVGVEAAEELVRLRVHHELLQQVVALLLRHHVPLSRHANHAHTLSSAGLQPASEAQQQAQRSKEAERSMARVMRTTSSWMKLVSCLSSARRLANSFFVAPDPDPEPDPDPDPGSASSIVPVRACQRSAKIN